MDIGKKSAIIRKNKWKKKKKNRKTNRLNTKYSLIENANFTRDKRDKNNSTSIVNKKKRKQT